MQKKQFITTIAIDDDSPPNDDLKFIRIRGFKPTNLLRSKIKELKEREEGAPTIEGLQATLQRIQKQISLTYDFLENEGLLDTYMKKINEKA